MTKEVPYTQEKRLYGDKRTTCRVVHCAHPGCHRDEAFSISTATGGIPTPMWHKLLTNKGWEIVRGHANCPDHHRYKVRAQKHAALIVEAERIVAAAQRIEPTPPPAQYVNMKEIIVPTKEPPTPIRSLDQLGEAGRLMTPEFRRRINREIFGNWDDVSNRYLGGTSDQKIATELGVPRAWVEQVRVENFGDSGGNEEIEELREDITVAISTLEPMVREAQRIVENVVNTVGNMEAKLGDLRNLRKRLEAVEAAVRPRRA